MGTAPTFIHSPPPPLLPPWKLYTSQPSCFNGQEWQGGLLSLETFQLPPPSPSTPLSQFSNSLITCSLVRTAVAEPSVLAKDQCRCLSNGTGSEGRGGGRGRIKEGVSTHIEYTPLFRRHHTQICLVQEIYSLWKERRFFIFLGTKGRAAEEVLFG